MLYTLKLERVRDSLPWRGVPKMFESPCRCVPPREMPVAMTQAWGSVCAGDKAQVERVVPCALRERDTSCSSAALRASHRSPSLKALGARYSV